METALTYPHTFTHEIVYIRPDGSRGACQSSDAYRDSTVAYYEGMGYRIDYVSSHALCTACGGEGKRAHKRNHYKRVPCAACKGEGQRAVVTVPAQP